MSQRRLSSLILWLGLSLLSAGGLQAQPLEIRFSTLPPDCAVAQLDEPERPSTVGSVRLQRPGPGEVLHFRLFKRGYASLPLDIRASDLPTGATINWPLQQGSFLRLEPLLVTAAFVTTPAGAQVWSSRAGRSDDYLGVTGQPVLLNLADLLGPSEGGFFRVRLVAPGYQSVEIPVPEYLFGAAKPNRWPAEGEYALAPTEGLLAPLVFYMRLKPWTGILLVITGISLLLLAWRLLSKGWASVSRARTIEQRTAEPGGVLGGSRLGPYRLYEVLGRGATATVFRGQLEQDVSSPGQADLAVKVFHLGSEASQRLAGEVRPLLELRHPNLVGLLDWGQSDRFAYLVTEMVPGRTLRQQLSHGPLELDHWRALVDDLLHGLAHAHARGVVHGDIKPENILMPWHGKAKIVDFGLARHIMRPGLERFGGTPGYLAPELTGSLASTPSSDQYAAGTVLFESVYGVFPGTAGWQPERYAELVPVFMRMRNVDPQRRYDDVEEARQALQSVRLKGSLG